MPQWTVQITDGEDERVEAGMLAMEGGALVALSDDGLVIGAWAPDQWRRVRLLAGLEAHPAGRDVATDVPTDALTEVQLEDNVVVGLPRP
jgi:hypothetical protein